MSHKIPSTRVCGYLDMQGFERLSPEEKAEITFGLRFTPILCNIVVLVGMYAASWEIFAVLACFGALGTFTDRFHPFDLLYSKLVSKILHKKPLPPNPAPKRFACALGMLFLIGAAVSFALGAHVFGYVFALGYILAAGLMAATHFCIGSWLYRKMFPSRSR